MDYRNMRQVALTLHPINKNVRVLIYLLEYFKSKKQLVMNFTKPYKLVLKINIGNLKLSLVEQSKD